MHYGQGDSGSSPVSAPTTGLQAAVRHGSRWVRNTKPRSFGGTMFGAVSAVTHRRTLCEPPFLKEFTGVRFRLTSPCRRCHHRCHGRTSHLDQCATGQRRTSRRTGIVLRLPRRHGDRGLHPGRPVQPRGCHTLAYLPSGLGIKYIIEYSTDGVTWTTYADETAAYSTPGIDTHAAVTARYLRIRITDSHGQGSSLWEFQVFGS
jgi:hypothetical protein